MNINDIGEFKIGTVIKRKSSEEGKEFEVINLKCIHNNGLFKSEDVSIMKVAENNIDSLLLSKKNDILIKMTAPYTVYIVREEAEGKIISSNYALFRTFESKLKAEYVYILIERLVKKATAVQSSLKVERLPLRELTTYKIEIDSEEYQEKLIKLSKLTLEYRKAYVELNGLYMCYDNFLKNKLLGDE